MKRGVAQHTMGGRGRPCHSKDPIRVERRKEGVGMGATSCREMQAAENCSSSSLLFGPTAVAALAGEDDRSVRACIRDS